MGRVNTRRAIPFAKGHGTGNDFVIFPDPDGELALSGEQVAHICDRRFGIGADGILRVVRAAKDPDAVALADRAEWFMDYRNSDGSLAQMCGNGARVFAHYLVRQGYAEPGAIPVATRDGIKEIQVDRPASASDDWSITVNMGLPRLGSTTTVTVGDRSLQAVAADVGNPHAVCVVTTPLAEFDLGTVPALDPAVFPDGANVELITPVEPLESGEFQIGMRVHERGAGETLSCGTGAVAAALAALGGKTGTVRVNVPGGELRIVITATTSFLTGPSVIVAEGEWLV